MNGLSHYASSLGSLPMLFRRQFTVAFLMLASLAGCSDSPGTTSSGTSEEKPAGTVTQKGTIGFSTLTLTNSFFKIIADTMTAEAKKYGYEVVVVSGDQEDAKNDPALAQPGK